MKTVVLGWRLMQPARRGERRLIALNTIGAAITALAILAIVSVPSVVAAQRDAVDRLEPQLLDSPVGAPLRMTRSQHLMSGRVLTTIAVATTETTAAPPEWLPEYPGPGESVVSPALSALIHTDSALRRQFPQQIVHVLDDNITVSPDQLWALVGVTPADVPADASAVAGASGFGGRAPAQGPADSAVRMILAGAVTFIALPSAAFFSITTRLSARTRRRKLAALRLLGVSQGRVRAVAVVENVTASSLGAIVGLLAWLALVRASSGFSIGGVRWHASDVSPSPITVIAVVFGVVIAGTAVGLASVSRAVTEPIENRVFPGIEPLRRVRVLPIVVAVVLLVGLAAVAGSLGRSLWLTGFVLAVILAGVGCPLAIPLLAASSSRPLTRSPRVEVHLAGRRLGHEATPAGRIVNGLLVAILIGAFAQTLLLLLDWSTDRDDTTAERFGVGVENAATTPATFETIDGVVSAFGTAVIPDERAPDAFRVFIADCDALSDLAPATIGCVDDAAQAIVFPNGAPLIDVPADGPNIEFTLTSESGATYLPGDLKVPPDHPLASQADIRDWTVVLETRAAYDHLVASLREVAPAATVQALDQTERGRLIGTYRSLVASSSLVALIMCLAATVVALLDRSRERRTSSGQLLAIGTPAGVLRRIEAIWVGVPALLGVALTAAIGTLIAIAYMRFGEADLAFPTSLFIGSLAAALTAAVVVTIAAALAVPRTVECETIDIER